MSADCDSLLLADTCSDESLVTSRLTEAQARIPKNPTFCTMCCTASFALVTKSYTKKTTTTKQQFKTHITAVRYE